MNNKEKLILSDVDGVLLDWVTGFSNWTKSKGLKRLPNTSHHYSIGKWYGITEDAAMELVATFNSSAAIGFLPPYLDAVKYVKKLHENYGYKFVAITAMGRDKHAIKLRKMNLEHVFGNVFEDLLVIDLLSSKLKLLKTYKPTIWLEDKPARAEEGVVAGHKTFLFDHGHNSQQETSIGITRVHKWKEVYALIASEEQGTTSVILPNRV